MSTPALPLATVQKYTNSRALMERLIKADNDSAKPNGVADDWDTLEAATRASTEADYFEVVNARSRSNAGTILGVSIAALDVIATFLAPEVMIPVNIAIIGAGGAGWLCSQD